MTISNYATDSSENVFFWTGFLSWVALQKLFGANYSMVDYSSSPFSSLCFLVIKLHLKSHFYLTISGKYKFWERKKNIFGTLGIFLFCLKMVTFLCRHSLVKRKLNFQKLSFFALCWGLTKTFKISIHFYHSQFSQLTHNVIKIFWWNFNQIYLKQNAVRITFLFLL